MASISTMSVVVKIADLKEVSALIEAVGNDIDAMPCAVQKAFDDFIEHRAKLLDEYNSAVLYHDLVEKFRKK